MIEPGQGKQVEVGSPLWSERFLNRVLYSIYGAVMVLILVLCLTARSVQYHNKGIEKPTGLLVFAVSLIFVGSFCCMAAKTAQKQERKLEQAVFFWPSVSCFSCFRCCGSAVTTFKRDGTLEP